MTCRNTPSSRTMTVVLGTFANSFLIRSVNFYMNHSEFNSTKTINGRTYRRREHIRRQLHQLPTEKTIINKHQKSISQITTYRPSKVLSRRIKHTLIPLSRVHQRLKRKFLMQSFLQPRIKQRRTRRSLQSKRIRRQMSTNSYITPNSSQP